MFLDLLDDKRSGLESLARNAALYDNPELRLWIAKALEYNTANAEALNAPFPERLTMLRDPPRQALRRDKQAKKPSADGR